MTDSVRFDPASFDHWRCPECGDECWTPKAQAALILWCRIDHGNVERDGKVIAKRGVYMQRVPDPAPQPTEGGA